MTGGFYFAHPSAVTDTEIRLMDDEARHAVKVMRLGLGDEIEVVDGEGGWYRAEISQLDRSSLVARIVETRKDVGEPASALVVGLGVLKNTSRFETFLEKMVELGVTRIAPFECDRTQKTSVNRGRAERILIAGMKQSMRSRLPELSEVTSFEDLISDDSLAGLRLIAHEGVSTSESLTKRGSDIEQAGRCVILIGPEGGFTDSELDLAQSLGWRLVSLGRSRLRAETAAIAAASVIQMIKSANDGPD